MGNMHKWFRGPFTEPESEDDAYSRWRQEMDDNGLDTGFRGRELWREGLSSKFKEARMTVDLEELKRLLAKATPPPWSVWDSCSFRRISHDRDGDVISAYNQRSDGQPDLLAKREDLTLTCSLRNAAPALIEELEALRARVRELEADKKYMIEQAAAGSLDGYRELGMKAAAEEERADQAEARLAKYQEQADAIHKYLTEGKTEAVMAVVTELSLDAARRKEGM